VASWAKEVTDAVGMQFRLLNTSCGPVSARTVQQAAISLEDA